MALSQSDIDAQLLRAARNKQVSVDGTSRTGPSITELLKLSAACAAAEATTSKRRPVLYQRMQSTSSGDRQ